MDYRFTKLAEYLRGCMHYVGISEYYRPIPEIVQWLRRRLRMRYFKQWRKARTKVRELRKLGTSLHVAISVANKPAKGRGDYPGRWRRKRG